MSQAHSKTVVYAAIAGNLAIAATKFVAGGITGSSAILSEGIHSTVDTGNGLLLLLGMHLSRRPATQQHPFGYGGESYFWSLIVAVLIFGVGGGVSIYEGILHLINPSEIESVAVNYVVLGIAAVFESITWAVAWRAFRKTKGKDSAWRAIRRSKDPTTFVVLFEDSAALLGLGVAFVGIFLGELFDSPYFDGAASILIGLILAAVACLLIYETRGLLLGESASPEVIASIEKILSEQIAVAEYRRPLTLHLGPDEILVALEVQFSADLSAAQAADAVDELEAEIRRQHPRVNQIFIEAEAIAPSERKPLATASLKEIE